MEREIGVRGMGNGRLGVWVVVLGILIGSGVGVFGRMEGPEFLIGSNLSDKTFFYTFLDTAGYTDAILYGRSPIHNESFHELLSGEWAAAIYYDGIDTALIDPANPSLGHQAMWLTRYFEDPDWPTYCQFSTVGTPIVTNNTNNPVDGNDKARTVITNGKVQITIDYEVVDLGESSANRSPMLYLDRKTGNNGVVYSDRYCFLQTYTFRNVDPAGQPLTNLEFSQMLHSHGADEYMPAVSSTYATYAAADPLQNYVPYDSVHEVGNFRYDITQWNDINHPSHSPYVYHTDFVGFSSTRQPDWVDNGIYAHQTTDETYVRIQKRSPNNTPSIYFNFASGAMGWDLGTLNANQTTSITFAVMWGAQQVVPSPIALNKTDNLTQGTKVEPGDTITYTICWENESLEDAGDVVLVDYLPVGVTYAGASWSIDPNWVPVPPDPGYDPDYHSYQWDLGTIPWGGTGCVNLTVTVNQRAEPGMVLENKAVMTSGNLGTSEAVCETEIDCWNTGSVIFVDKRATGYRNGTSWRDAYPELWMALARAGRGCESTIWVAKGTYSPGHETTDSFILPAEVSVYGGFAGTEDPATFDPNQRDLKTNATILTGLISDTKRNETVVTMGNNSLLDGVTVADSSVRGRGIFGQNVNYAVSNCIIENNQQYGIRSENCNATIQWCMIRNNENNGIYQEGANKTLSLDNSLIVENKRNGIYVLNSVPTIRNSVISGNGSSGTTYYGIDLVQPSGTAIIRNNTIVYNENEGIRSFGANNPSIENCIVCYNNSDGGQIQGYTITGYSCVIDPNSPPHSTPDTLGNINWDPGFAYGRDPNNIYHIAANSPCLNKGNPTLDYSGQKDIDNETRLMGDRVDIGADEVDPACSSVFHSLDWDSDGLINYVEFTKFSKAWMTFDPNNPLCNPSHPNYISDPNNPAYISSTDKARFNPVCDLDNDLDVDLADLVVFAHNQNGNWLWTACWRTDLRDGFTGGMMMAMASPESESTIVMANDDLAMNPSADRMILNSIVEKGTIALILYEVNRSIEDGHPNQDGLVEMREFLIECVKEIDKGVRYRKSVEKTQDLLYNP